MQVLDCMTIVSCVVDDPYNESQIVLWLDGNIHLWIGDYINKSKSSLSIKAHHGHVNDVKYSPYDANLLFRRLGWFLRIWDRREKSIWMLAPSI
jgi:hypothetical protein